MADPGQSRKAERIFRVRGRKDTPLGKPHLVRAGIKLRRGDARQLVAQPACRQIRRPRRRSGKAARIIAGGDRPGIPAGIERRLDPHHRRGQTKDIPDNLRRRAAVPLALRQ